MRRVRSAVRGFTLIELMVAVAVIGILATIAVPMYSDYILRSRLVSGTSQLSAARAQMEQFFQDNRTYTGGPCATAATVDSFTVGCTAAGALTATTYILTAAGSGPTNGFSYTINQQGAMTTTFGTAWGGSTVNGCWLVRRGTAC